ncbi:Peptidase M50, putative membrane-associated zinc metallopeptidase [Candidatus Koribacter versatilis Ellin345]|uniref:Zinc metalloprotease n=1 Tax=Koribacter versatilis (strain Ellin345) TaxID=204669 RepID=Q1IRS8_KORVE|nr:RIP metalloprotease RseP [Candidatus Koribacter versatilis]ABF40422.1 Peptidase M50, putative membrane-associated zinc metallopeptidase [Candidatus Koribacter versatilis Ellin345]
MEGFLIAIVSIVFVLGVLVLVHEFGHFAAAKLFGVRVETFSIGFGKRLVGFRRGETDYRISALPLGGYVKMTGETPLDSRTGAPEEFMSHPRWQRIIIALAGPFMNIALAIGLLTVVYMVHDEEPAFWGEKATVGFVAPGSTADKVGVKAGDTIVKIANVDNPTWEDVYLQTSTSPGAAVRLDLLRDRQVIATSVVPEKGSEEQGSNPGWTPYNPNTVASLEAEMPAAKAGIKVGDSITAIDGAPIYSTESMIAMLQQTKEKPVELTVQRDGKEFKVTVTPQLTNDKGESRYRIGMVSEPKYISLHLPFKAALSKSLDENRKFSFLVVDLVKKLARGAVSIKTMSSPIGMAKASGEAARQPGWSPLMRMMALFSLQLGIFNLFPIPILDGGMILMLLIEGLMRRDISMRIKERAYQVAFVFLMLFAAVVIFNDIVKTVPGLHQHLP